jgi:hypothetical protein
LDLTRQRSNCLFNSPGNSGVFEAIVAGPREYKLSQAKLTHTTHSLQQRRVEKSDFPGEKLAKDLGIKLENVTLPLAPRSPQASIGPGPLLCPWS